MTNQVDQETDTASYLEMSDDELLAMGAPSVEAPEVEASADPETPVAPAADAEDGEDSAEDTAESADEADPQGQAEDGAPTVEKLQVPEKQEKPVADTNTPKDPKQAAAVDFEAEYKRLLAPFKANGRDISVGNVDDAIALMQMGANYNKKMAALKPNLKLMKLLENNGLMSEENIGFLIDLSKKNPAAINKLVKDSGIDPLDLNDEQASAYQKPKYAVDDREIELDTVLDEIQDSPTYTRTLDIVSSKWDGASKQVVATSPQLIKLINDHVSRGIYDVIAKEMESERMFGRLDGLSDIEAYRKVGDAIQARGGFNHLGSSQGKPAPVQPVVVQPNPKQGDDDELKNKRRAAGSPRPVAPTQTPQDFNPLSLSDEEFSKLASKKYV